MLSLCSPLVSRSLSSLHRNALVCAALPVLLTLGSVNSYAADTPLMQGAHVAITSDDVVKNIENMPTQVRQDILSDPAKLRQLVGNLYLRRALATQAEHDGLTKNREVQFKLDTARESVLAEAQVERIANAATPNAAAVDKLVQSIYKAEPERFSTPTQTQARHILIKGTDASSRAQAEKLLAELKTGANFEDLARQYSADPGSAAKGGDLGFFPKGRMVQPFEKALDALVNPGDLSPVVESSFGFHIIRLEARKSATLQPFEEVQAQLHAEIVAKIQQDARLKEVKRLQDQATGDHDALEAFMAAQKQATSSTTPAPTAAVK
ncbi:peptidylprolyl isomerase [Simplicispira psychrophila]|uniref:peptidylprolyl isomerase n=1 Tax=Simplicispira psychrophila TaxID=80882 RepID=UPI001B804EE2|nr:peptidylprolyl isomerase [Simplicispira psychrophila]